MTFSEHRTYISKKNDTLPTIITTLLLYNYLINLIKKYDKKWLIIADLVRIAIIVNRMNMIFASIIVHSNNDLLYVCIIHVTSVCLFLTLKWNKRTLLLCSDCDENTHFCKTVYKIKISWNIEAWTEQQSTNMFFSL